jgi:hypothetical protein
LRKRIWMRLIIGFGVAMLGVSCTGSDEPTAPDRAPDGGNAALQSDGRDSGGESAKASPEGEEGELEDQGGPLFSFLYQVGDAGAIDAAALYERRYQQLIVDCMAEQGFDYEPRHLDQPEEQEAGGEPPFADVFDLPREDFVARYGYGITTIDPAELGLSEPPDGAESSHGEGLELSPEEQAYAVALDGSTALHDVRRDGPYLGPDDPEDRGCRGAARRAMEEQEDGSSVDLSPFATLTEEIGALWDRAERDPRVTQARESWSDCMADAGHPGLRDLPDAQAEIRDRLEALLPPSEAAEEGSDHALDDHLVPGPAVARLAASDPVALEELRTLELSMAAAEHRCRPDYDRTRWMVRDEVEQAFLDANLDELEAYRDALAAAQGRS